MLISCYTRDPLHHGIIIQSAKWNVDADQTMDTAFSYTVTTTGSLIEDMEMGLRSFATDGDSAIHITESLSNGVNLLVASPDGPFIDHHVFRPVRSLRVNKDISLEGHTTGGASLSTLYQEVSQIPEPTTAVVACLGIGICATARSRRRSRAIPN